MGLSNHDKVGIAEALFKVENGDNHRPYAELDNIRVQEDRATVIVGNVLDLGHLFQQQATAFFRIFFIRYFFGITTQ